MATRVALAGATGNLGPSILKALLDAGFEVTILTRKGSKSADALPQHPKQKIVQVDYDSLEDLTAALQGHQAYVSVLGAQGLEAQKVAIDAALAAGVSRFIPSEFGCDLQDPLARALPAYQDKIKIEEYLETLAAKHSNFSYTLIYNNAFFDWGLKAGFVAQLKEHKITFYDGGEHPISYTTLATIGKGVAGVISKPEATKNRTVYIHDIALSQRQLIDFVKSIDGQAWTIEEKDTKELAEAALAETKKPQPDFRFWVFGQIYRAAFGKESRADFTGRTDNALLGLAENDKEYLTNVVKSLLV